jgi:hypothetical protein
VGEVVKARKDRETKRKWKRLLKQPGDDDEDDEEIGRWPGDGAVPPLHEEEEVIGSILTSAWDDLGQEKEEDNAPQRPSGPFPLHAKGQEEDNIPPRAMEANLPASHGLPKQHAG